MSGYERLFPCCCRLSIMGSFICWGVWPEEWWWLPLSLVHGRGGGEGEVWKNLRGGGGECWLPQNGATPSAMCCTMCKSGWVGIWHKRLENVSSVLCWHPHKGYTRCRHNPMLIEGLPSGHLFSRLIRHTEIRWAYSTPRWQVNQATKFIDNILNQN